MVAHRLLFALLAISACASRAPSVALMQVSEGATGATVLTESDLVAYHPQTHCFDLRPGVRDRLVRALKPKVEPEPLVFVAKSRTLLSITVKSSISSISSPGPNVMLDSVLMPGELENQICLHPPEEGPPHWDDSALVTELGRLGLLNAGN